MDNKQNIHKEKRMKYIVDISRIYVIICNVRSSNIPIYHHLYL